ncbi:hypothetical protein N0V95_001763 [Ascochyta clinopodiicola]|nr:hypothetical protein N0V95_001763 [Ascochyta clinopodiicola]
MKLSHVASALSLLGVAISQSCPNDKVNGYASVGSGTTGGESASPIVVKNAEQLRAAAKASGPAVIVIDGMINTNGVVKVSSDKTIKGQNKNAGIVGGFAIDAVSNIILQNLNVRAGAAADAIASTRPDHIWYDHLNIYDAAAGLLDITKQSDYQTVSWCKFWYRDGSADHRLASLLSSGGGTQPYDEGKLRVTYHHNWWADNVDQSMPRVMYGEAHVYNNFYNSKGNTYCIGFGSYGSVLIENNYFKDVRSPHEFMYDVYAFAKASGNVYDKTSGNRQAGRFGDKDADGHDNHSAGPFTPPYSFSLGDAKGVQELVQRFAGPR